MQLLEKIRPLWVGRAAQDRRILVINGHPDPALERFCSALCDAYEEGARQAGWTVRRLTIGLLSNNGTGDKALEDMGWATQLIVAYPLWLDQLPVSLRDLFEENFTRSQRDGGGVSEKAGASGDHNGHARFPLSGNVAMRNRCEGIGKGMTLPGFRHQHQDFIGSIASITPEQLNQWLKTMHHTGLRAA
jgi:putative NADPH-quinone reductase